MSLEIKTNKKQRYKALYLALQIENERLKKELEKTKNELEKVRKSFLSLTNKNTAQNGYKEENMVCDDLNGNHEIHTLMYEFIGNDFDKCFRVEGTHKCDIMSNDTQLRAQVKKFKNGQFQQLHRQWANNFIQHIPGLEKESQLLTDMCEYPLLPNGTHVDKSIPIKPLKETHYSGERLAQFTNTINENKMAILEYAFLGNNPEVQPDYLIGVEYVNEKRIRLVAMKVSDILDYLKTLDFKIKKKGTVITLGDNGVISIQRKGGDGGRKASNQLQIKIIVSVLIANVKHIKFNYE